MRAWTHFPKVSKHNTQIQQAISSGKPAKWNKLHHMMKECCCIHYDETTICLEMFRHWRSFLKVSTSQTFSCCPTSTPNLQVQKDSSL
jgi:hypothetical protein